ncbi:PKD domain-containing protein [Candidatus Gracilibacteria bacterium]|nr:PKD domain-containing protein [Candidatus Gracilibacteria bacterium]
MDNQNENTNDIKVNSYANAPENTPVQSQEKVEPEKQTIGQVKNNVNPSAKPPLDPEARRKAIKKLLMVAGIVGGVIAAVSLFMISKVDEDGNNLIAQTLNLNSLSFTNILSTTIHIIFMLAALAVVVFVMRSFMAMNKVQKEDTIGRKVALKKLIIRGVALFLLMIVWVTALIFIEMNRSLVTKYLQNPIVTTPAQTLNLTAPVEIKFDASHAPIDRAIFQVISYDWDFGDNKTGTSQVVTHTYEKKGRFDVVLAITKRNKTTSEESKDTYAITVVIDKQALSAIIKADKDNGPIPLEVSFDGSDSVNPDGTIRKFEWDFDGDGKIDETGETIKHTFEKAGIYKVSLKITSSTGDSAVIVKEIMAGESDLEAVISVLNEPTEFVKDTSYIFKADQSVSKNSTIEKYEWDFGDGTKTETGKTISHTFKKEGAFEIMLTVTDKAGSEGEVKKIINIGSPKGTPKAVISSDPTIKEGDLAISGKVPFAVVFNGGESADSDQNIVDYKWDFNGDAKYEGFGKNITHTFTEAGTFTVTLEVEDADNNTSQATIAVRVLEQGIQADLKADKVEGTAPLIVAFDASGSTYQSGKITSYKWEFGDGTAPKLSTASITHKYASIGTYTAKVTVVGSDNSSDSEEITITVRETPLSACFTTNFKEGQAPLDVIFDPACSTGTTANYYWDFGDGASSTDVKPTHTFTKEGTYKVELQITDVDNTVSSFDTEIKVLPKQ